MALPTGLKINGVDMPSPIPYEVTTQSLDGKAGRNTSAKMMRDFRADKKAVNLSWGLLTLSEAQKILRAVSPAKGNIFFQATIQTVEDGEYTGTFYAGDRKETVALFTPSGTMYKGLSFTIIER